MTKAKKEKKCTECEKNLAGWKRALADYENLKKQTEIEKQEFVRFANANLLLGLIPVYENLKLALVHAPKNNEWTKGVEHIKNQFKQVFDYNGVEEIIPKAGDKFDIEIHEAVEHTDKIQISADNTDKSKISKVVSCGYKLNSKVFVPAKVVVK